MNLNNNNLEWEQVKNDTPTFRLTPVEKPDMSPFLFHMTGPNAIKGILSERKDQTKGFLRSEIPEKQNNRYKSPVVCFTESPIFCLDFFRFRSEDRWKNNQQYGLGFSKEQLIKEYDVRPVIYLENELNSLLNDLYNYLCYGAREPLVITCSNSQDSRVKRIFNGRSINEKIQRCIKKIYPLLFPLLENKIMQGFMWEREWRYPYDNGFEFNYSDIKIICCPKSEKKEIQDIFAESNFDSKNIVFIDSWNEYKAITDFLKQQESMLEIKSQEDLQAENFAIENVDELERYSEKIEILIERCQEKLKVYHDSLLRLEEERFYLETYIIERSKELKAIKKEVRANLLQEQESSEAELETQNDKEQALD